MFTISPCCTVQIITEKSLEVEGIASPLGTRSRWAREGSMSITKLEVPHLLESLVNQVCGRGQGADGVSPGENVRSVACS